MSSLQESDIEIVRRQGEEWVREAIELRSVRVDGEDPPAALSDPDAPLPAVHEALVLVRGCLDRLEVIFSSALALSSSARINARGKADAADDKLNEAIRDHSRRARQFEAAQERLAEASLDALDVRREARTAQKVADLADGFERRIRLHYYGLAALRDELAKRLAHVSREWALDR